MDKSYWNEQWMGYPVGPHYEQQSNITNAAKLQGRLMLMVGELDDNVPPESTYRLADALIKAKKEFELIVIPGAGIRRAIGTATATLGFLCVSSARPTDTGLEFRDEIARLLVLARRGYVRFSMPPFNELGFVCIR